MGKEAIGQVVVFFKMHTKPEVDSKQLKALDHSMYDIVSQMPGFLSIETYTSGDGDQVGIVRFTSEEALAAWRNHPDHRAAMKRGREEFYDYVWVQVAKVLRDYEIMPKGVEALKESMKMAGSWTAPGTETDDGSGEVADPRNR